MIHVERSTVPEPEHLRSSAAKAARKEAWQPPTPGAKQVPFKTAPLLFTNEVRGALRLLFHGKCAFCESPIAATAPGDIAHYRPAEGALDSDGAYAPNHYRWLAYEWSNIYLSCAECMRFKGHRFPVDGPRAAFGTQVKALASERPLLLDPCGVELPANHLVFSSDGMVASATTIGRNTIDILGLNRRSLVQARLAEASRWRGEMMKLDAALKGRPSPASLQSLRDAIAGLATPQRPYSVLRQQLVAEWVRKLSPDLREQLQGDVVPKPSEKVSPIAQVKKLKADFAQYEASSERYSLARTSSADRYYSKARFIERIEIEDFRLIPELELDFASPDSERAHWMAILGENGCGKSSVLQAISLALLGSTYRKALKLDPKRFIRKSSTRAAQPKRASVRIFLSGSTEPIELTVTPRTFHSNADEPRCLILGYGATRLLPRRGFAPERGSRFARVENLFNPFSPLARANEWFLKRRPAEFRAAANVVRALLGLPESSKLSIRREKLFIDGQPLPQLSDGYQSMLALATDIMGVMFTKWSDMKLAEGVVLIDEIESHLHPAWKIRIVKQFRTCFPRIQFVITTHDPLCLRGLEKGEVVSMKRDEKRGIMIERDLPEIRGLQIDQLLTSDYFGLSSAADSDVEETFRQYYTLLANPKPTPDEIRKREELRIIIESKRLLGSNDRERLMLDAIDLYLAEARLRPSEKPARDDVKKRIAALWSKPIVGGVA